MNKEEIENLFLKTTRPKIKQKIELLRINNEFQTNVKVLRKKWVLLVKDFNYYLEKIYSIWDSILNRTGIKFINGEFKMSSLSKKEEATLLL